MRSKEGILVIPIILAFYFIVGTPEYKLEVSEHLELNKVAQIANLAVVFDDIETQMTDFTKELESLKYDDNIPLNYELQLHLKVECERHNVDFHEALAIMTVENPSFDPAAINKNNNGTVDIGLFQINSCNLRDFENMGYSDLKNPKENISYGIYFISKLDKYDGHEKYMAYNMGEVGMKKAISRGINNTPYSRKIMGLIE